MRLTILHESLLQAGQAGNVMGRPAMQKGDSPNSMSCTTLFRSGRPDKPTSSPAVVPRIPLPCMSLGRLLKDLQDHTLQLKHHPLFFHTLLEAPKDNMYKSIYLNS